VVADIVNGADVRMMERGRGTRLTFEAVRGVGVV
jgi:hypothetical protein